MTYLVLWLLIGALAGFIAGALLMDSRLQKVRARWHARQETLLGNAASERDLLARQIERERVLAREERRELYSRIQANDPNVGDYTPSPPPAITAPPSRPEEVQTGPRSYTEEELAQLKLVQQADGMIRDSRTDALFETVEDWRFWQADLKKRGLPEDVHPGTVREQGYEEAVHEAKLRRAQAKATAKN
jgi:hypothetical protein